MPETFPQSGFQLGAVHVAKGWKGDIRFSDLTTSQQESHRPGISVNRPS